MNTSMINANVFFLLGAPCSGKTTVGKILATKYRMYYFSGDERRFDYYKFANVEKHTYMKKDTSDFWNWSLDEMVEWERGVIAEQTPYILRDLDVLSSQHRLVLFEGMLDIKYVSRLIPPSQIVYLSVERDVCEEEFIEREDHKGMFESIIHTPGICEQEKHRRVTLRKDAAVQAFFEDTAELKIKSFMRNEENTVSKMVNNVESHFHLKNS